MKRRKANAEAAIHNEANAKKQEAENLREKEYRRNKAENEKKFKKRD